MKTPLVSLLTTFFLLPSLWALPQDFGDLTDLFGGGLAADGRDLTSGFLAAAVWRGEAELPGKWRDAYEVGSRSVRHIAAAPYLFGHVPIGAEAVYEAKKLDRVSIYYLESGTFFGYEPKLRDTREGRKTLQDKERQFRKIFDDLEKSLEDTLHDLTDDRGESMTEGRTRGFKQRFRQYERDGLALQLRAKKDAYVRVDLRRAEEVTPSFLPLALETLSKRDRRAALQKNVDHETDGTIRIQGIPMIYQGGRAYCGVTTYLMAAQYLGIDVDAATMASESGFRYGMGGKKMIEAYNAVAREGGMRMSRSTKLDGDRVRASLEEGIPVVVWRRFDVQRNRLHIGNGDRGRSGVFASLPEPDEAERAAWPGAEAPAHASVITGFDPGSNEIIFSDSWGEHARDKRMRVEEMEATAYYAFYFSL